LRKVRGGVKQEGSGKGKERRGRGRQCL